MNFIYPQNLRIVKDEHKRALERMENLWGWHSKEGPAAAGAIRLCKNELGK